MLDEVSTAIHGGAAAVKVKERVYFTPKNTNKPSLTPVCYSVFRGVKLVINSIRYNAVLNLMIGNR